MPDTILIVDDEVEIADLIDLYLQNEGYATRTFYEAQSALDCIKQEDIDLAILDIMMPDIDGFTLCSKVRELRSFPIIMLTARDDVVDKITGLTLGADDYVTKPFKPLELVARVKAQLRRYKKYNDEPAKSEALIVIGGLEINSKTHECSLDGKALKLTPTEFSLLRILASNQGAVMSSDELSQEIWQDEYFEKGNTSITVHIRHIREKMGESFENPRYIKTVWGVGYKLDNN
ncbi:MAG: response regulator transcription factor [Coriobacteriia bacterium]|nr:response regulator transcription factor [Coriobacteriia bacterium]